jgi:carbon-monoxide dehydrogenase medium subunit
MSTSAPFEYLVADTWDRALDLLVEVGPQARILAGGQSLIPMLNLRRIRPAALIDINPIPTPEPRVDHGVLVLPALARQQTLLRSPLIRRHSPLLAAGVRHLGNVRVRNLGTLGGSLCHADPAAEIPCVVLALGGRLLIRGPAGTRTVAADDFFRDPPRTTVGDDELLTEIRLPVRRPGEGWAFHETARRHGGTATVGVAATVRLTDDRRTVQAATVALAGVAPRPITLAPELLGDLVGSTGAPVEVEAVANAAAAHISPGADVRAGSAQRRRLTAVLTRRALTDALDQARLDDTDGEKE